MNETIINVDGMMCEGCENRIKNAVKEIKGVKDVIANHIEKKVTIIGENVDIDKIKEKIEDIGFTIL